MSNATPSTAWQEVIPADEAAQFAAYVPIFDAIQQRKSARYGSGRALHRKQLTAAKGWLDVAPDLPDFARQGLFARPGRFEAWVRLSNGGFDRAPDKVPDIRGFAIRAMGVQGDSALGNGPAVSQDFLLINQEKFSFPKSAEFVAFVAAAGEGKGALLKHLFKTYGLFGAIARVKGFSQSVGRPFSGFATEPLFSAVPIACGPYAVRVRLVPATANAATSGAADGPGDKGADWGADFAARLQGAELGWELQLQPFVSEALTPIEDASVNWPTPYTTVARLTLPAQDTSSAEGQRFSAEAEAAVFDPWQALAEHRPLGDVQRARKVVYFASQKGRGAA